MSDAATLTKPPVNAPTPKTNILNASHRCDRCSAAAYVMVNLRASDAIPNGGVLMFCSHHYNKVDLALAPFVEGDVIDERHKLEQNKLVGTENS